MLPARELGVALTRIHPVTVRGPFFRTVAFKYLKAVGRGASNILSGVPGCDRGGRYNPAGRFPTTYLAESVETAVSEGVRPSNVSSTSWIQKSVRESEPMKPNWWRRTFSTH